MTIRNSAVRHALEHNGEGWQYLFQHDPYWHRWIKEFDKLMDELERILGDEDVPPEYANRIIRRMVERVIPDARTPDERQRALAERLPALDPANLPPGLRELLP